MFDVNDESLFRKVIKGNKKYVVLELRKQQPPSGDVPSPPSGNVPSPPSGDVPSIHPHVMCHLHPQYVVEIILRDGSRKI